MYVYRCLLLYSQAPVHMYVILSCKVAKSRRIFGLSIDRHKLPLGLSTITCSQRPTRGACPTRIAGSSQQPPACMHACIFSFISTRNCTYLCPHSIPYHRVKLVFSPHHPGIQHILRFFPENERPKSSSSQSSGISR